jgi:hypothetical protein
MEGIESIEPNILLSYLDSIHDFKRHLGMVDTPNTVRGEDADKIHYWRNFAFNILRLGMGGTPSHSYLLNGCTQKGIHPEELGLALVKRLAKLRDPIEIVYRPGSEAAFYDSIAAALKEYKQGTKIPIVADTEFSLHNDSRSIDAVAQHFAICKNREVYADPSRTAKRDYYDAEYVEVPDNPVRVYQETTVGASPLYIHVGGPIDAVKIQYRGVRDEVYLTEEYKLANRVLPNTIANCKDAFKSLLKTGDFHSGPIGYCNLMKGGKEFTSIPGLARSSALSLNSSWNNLPLLRIMTIHLMKKRHGDQFQVRSCKESIKYRHSRHGNVVFGKDKPCVFWSYDRLAIAYAIFLGVPCVYQLTNKNVTIFIPLKGAKCSEEAKEGGWCLLQGGACTRADLEHTVAELNTTSEALMDEINGDNDCLKRYVELHLEIDKIQYSPIYLLYILKMKRLTEAGLSVIDKKIFFEKNFIYHVYHKHPQLYIKEDRDEHTAQIVEDLNNDASILFYSLRYHFFISISANTIYVKTTSDGSTIGPTVTTIYEFTSSIVTADEYAAFEEPLAGGAMKGGSLTPKRNPLLNLLQRMKQVENYMVVFSDSRDRFMAEDKRNFIERGGYTSYEMVFFFRAAVELFERAEDKAQFSKAFRAVFDTLNALGEEQLSNEISFFLNTFTKFHSKSLGTEEAKPIIAAVLEVAKAYTEELETAMKSFGFHEDKMIDYLEKHVPHGILAQYYEQLASALQSYSARPAGAPTTLVKPLRSRSRSGGVTKRRLSARNIPASKREHRRLTKRNLSASLEGAVSHSKRNRDIVRGTRLL